MNEYLDAAVQIATLIFILTVTALVGMLIVQGRRPK